MSKSESTILTAVRVEEIFMDCLFQPNEDTTNYVKAEGLVNNVGFHPKRLEGHKKEIALMLDELPDVFKTEDGGGMSFLQACMTKQGHQWGEHRSMEQLFQLGVATEKATLLTPRDMWSILPGGMPYYCIN